MKQLLRSPDSVQVEKSTGRLVSVMHQTLNENQTETNLKDISPKFHYILKTEITHQQMTNRMVITSMFNAVYFKNVRKHDGCKQADEVENDDTDGTSDPAKPSVGVRKRQDPSTNDGTKTVQGCRGNRSCFVIWNALWVLSSDKLGWCGHGRYPRVGFDSFSPYDSWS